MILIGNCTLDPIMGFEASKIGEEEGKDVLVFSRNNSS